MNAGTQYIILELQGQSKPLFADLEVTVNFKQIFDTIVKGD